MTGLLLVGPPPGPAPAAPRAAQPLRSDGPGFADSLRSASSAPGRELREPEPAQGDSDAAPETAETTDSDAGEATDAVDRDADRATGDREDAAAPEGEQRDDDEAKADDAPAAGAVAAKAARSETSGGEGARENAAPARAVRGEAASSSRTQNATLPTAGDAAGEAQADGKAPALEVAGASVKRAASSDAKSGEPANAQQSQQAVAGVAGDADAATAGGAGRDDAGDRSDDRASAERAIRKSDPAGAFELSRADAKPGGDAPVREAPTQAAADAARPSPVRIEGATPPTRGAEQAGPGAEPADDSAAMTAVKRGLGAAVRQRGGSVTIKLSPESLGQVRIQMQIHQGKVELRFDASTEQARELLTRHADMLRTTLQQKGFGVDRIDVHTQPSQPTGGRAGADASGDDASQRRSQEHDAGGGESRGSFSRQGDERRDGAWRDDDDAPTTFEQWRVRVNATA